MIAAHKYEKNKKRAWYDVSGERAREQEGGRAREGEREREHSFTHPLTDGGVDHAGRQPARREQSGGGVSLRDTSTLR